MIAVPTTAGAAASFRDRLRGFGPLGVLSLVLVLGTGNLVGPTMAVFWTWASRTPWKDLGFVRPKSWWTDVIIGLLSGIAFKILLKAVVLPPLGVPDVNRTYSFLVGNTAVLPRILFMMIVGGGVGEEVMWRGFLFDRLKALLGSSWPAGVVIVLFTSLLFASAHLLDQGWPGATQAVFTGLAFGLAYRRLRRIWPVMMGHAAFDMTAVLMIYWNVERQVAHWIFR